MAKNAWTAALLQYGALLAVLAAMLAAFGAASENFLQTSSLVTIANQTPELTFIAVGMTLVLAIAGIDLSVGSILALCSAVLGVLMVDYEWPLWAAAMPCLLVGVACGAFNGLVSVGFGIPSFIVTLGMLEMARGATKAVSNSQTKYIGSEVEWLGPPANGMVSPAFILAVITVVVGQFVLTKTVFGRYCIAVGANKEALRMCGVRTWPLHASVFMISGLMCALAGLSRTSQLSSSDPNTAVGIELSAIAACVIGGTSLMGGRASVVSSFLGVLIISVLQSGLAQVGVADHNKQIVTGAVIVAAVLLDALRNRWRGA
ncbi:MAG TPA: ABC transporter permease [Planctomycetaceae bacterium]|nr:ABC transporter permease [Planctomycetaceae bacterium]